MSDREKLIEIFKTLLNSWAISPESAADLFISNGVTVQKWIPVSERLPEDWEDVLVFSKYGFCETAVYLGIEGKWRVSWNYELLEGHSVTHWMPLPEPPKECE